LRETKYEKKGENRNHEITGIDGKHAAMHELFPTRAGRSSQAVARLF
jgi:hypothetical protein